MRHVLWKLAMVCFIAVLMFTSIVAADDDEKKRRRKRQEPKDKDQKGGRRGGMGGGGGPGSEMIFITIRKDYVPEGGLERMAAGFQEIMMTGGLAVSVVAVDEHQMIALASNVMQVMEVRRFACDMEQVLKVEYDKKTFPGLHISEEEREEIDKKEKKIEKKEDL